MTRRRPAFVALLVLCTAVGLAGSSTTRRGAGDFVAHEWGTFTSIASEDGSAEEWLPLGGPPDLPCFVDRLQLDLKGQLAGTVRMETPVLYFYASRETAVDVSVRFKQGVVTEWFPRADVTPAVVGYDDLLRLRQPGFTGTVHWRDVTVHAGREAALRDDGSASHYYVARQTDASPISTPAATEKFLFYRGVGNFQPSVAATPTSSGGVRVWSRSEAPAGVVMLFENRGGRVSYRMLDTSEREITFDPLPSDNGGDSRAPMAELRAALLARGLYPKEADAMVRTWRDSWFEEGSRLFYIVPRRVVDDVLPIAISPAPSALARVFVGRVELFTPATLHTVEQALAANDRDILSRYRRFLPSILKRLSAQSTPAERTRWTMALERALRTTLPQQRAVCH
jgi:hypothetical protein